ncbi:50S ribosomal protein L23 [Candidatus Pacearchaeota archaeon CG10_big_fil_rev_8_21_14_0_10_32_14]|nr:MAG: 50S ribosomal protein L23 [Candidatus Pacearchaeota archaeon CG10_big_fil_rev_8_21_14_0_10_32_14]
MRAISLKPIVSEKAVMLIETKNTLLFELEKTAGKKEIKKEIEEIFDVKIKSVNTLIKNNKKYAYVRLNDKFPAIDIATKLGLI